jgi:hypothetical protein
MASKIYSLFRLMPGPEVAVSTLCPALDATGQYPTSTLGRASRILSQRVFGKKKYRPENRNISWAMVECGISLM